MSYSFGVWLLFVACSLAIRLDSPPCIATDGFDLSPLSGSTPYTWTAGRFTYTFNLCKPLGNDCNWESGVAVCMSYNMGSEISLGLTSTQHIVYNSTDNSYNFLYSGGDPADDNNRTTQIKVLCNQVHALTILNLTTSIDGFDILITAESVHACNVPPPAYNCTTTDAWGNNYDLTLLQTPLSFSTNIGNSQSKFLIAPCATLIPSVCGYNAAACLINSDGTFNLGLITSLRIEALPYDPLAKRGAPGIVANYYGGPNNIALTAYLLCDPQATTTTVQSIVPVTPDSYITTISTQSACPTTSP
eukprot:comp22096_c0_seq1/m.51318 comp22096_c0_seq1/g.51318  ORF comp22096_c0_seq1/g.51318 comp22096_c0_seq1/m.51318 type:complete len:303 (+) comp22096_c0_seq1:3-911(+)